MSDYLPFCVGEPYTIDDVIAGLAYPKCMELLAPEYTPGDYYSSLAHNPRVAMAVPSMAQHTSDEGFQLMLALEHGGYWLAGYGLENQNSRLPITHVPELLRRLNPGIIVVQDKREWEGRTAGVGFDYRESFTGVDALAGWPSRFKLTVLKDAHANPAYHAASATEMGCHAWICYYHPRIVHHVARFVRPQHLIRTYHTIDSNLFKPVSQGGGGMDISLSEKDRRGALLSGAISDAYPLRKRIRDNLSSIPGLERLPHPGYHRRGCETPGYLKILSGYKVAICTSSKYGYALRKIIEATAVGCRVVTDLPVDDQLPFIDGNLFRVRSDISISTLNRLLIDLYASWDGEKQGHYASLARTFYDFRFMGLKLSEQIEQMRARYNDHT